MDMRMITDATPITMPSMVKSERVLPCRKLETADFTESRSCMLFSEIRDGTVWARHFCVAFEFTILYAKDAVGEFRRVRLMRYQNYCVAFAVQIIQNTHHLCAGF